MRKNYKVYRLLQFWSLLLYASAGPNGVLVSVASDYSITLTNIRDGMVATYSPPTNHSTTSMRPFHRHGNQGYNQYILDDAMFVLDSEIMTIVENILTPRVAKVLSISLPNCDPLTMTSACINGLSLYVYCRPNAWNGYQISVYHVANTSVGWRTEKVWNYGEYGSGSVAMFMETDKLYLITGLASSAGLIFCDINEQLVYPIDDPSGRYVHRMRSFEKGVLFLECTASENETQVLVTQVYSMAQSRFSPFSLQQSFLIGGLIFSKDQLIVGIVSEKTVTVYNVSDTSSGSPTGYVTFEEEVVDAHLVGKGTYPLLVASTKNGVYLADTEQAFEGKSQTPLLLEGTEDICVTSDCPILQIVDDDFVMIPLSKGVGIFSLSSNRAGTSTVLQGSTPVRMAFFMHADRDLPHKALQVPVALVGSASAGVFACCYLVLVLALAVAYIVKKRRNRRQELTPPGIEEITRDGPSTLTVSTATGRRQAVSISHRAGTLHPPQSSPSAVVNEDELPLNPAGSDSESDGDSDGNIDEVPNRSPAVFEEVGGGSEELVTRQDSVESRTSADGTEQH